VGDGSGGPVDPEERSPRLGLKHKDLAVMEALLGQGADLAARREVVYYSYAPSRGQAAAIGDAARSRGFRVEVREPQREPGEWEVVCSVGGVVSPEFVRSNGDFFEDLAARNGAEYDGWQAAVRPLSPPQPGSS
jgi:hypothetical protein